MPSLVTERIESVKAGILAAIIFSLVDGLVIAVNHYFLFLISAASWQSGQVTSTLDLLIRLAIAMISGFLFGVTYRYLIRGENNFHLQDGAVLAFALVRGFALIEGTNPGFFWLAIIIESILSFSSVRFCLDYALKFKLVKPYNLKGL